MRTPMVVFTLVLGLSLGSTPSTTADPGPATFYDLVVETVVGEFGFLPATALVDGVEVPTDDALRLLRENPFPLDGNDNQYVWDDTGVGVRQTAFTECLVAGQTSAISVTLGPSDPLVNREINGLSNPTDAGPTGGSTILCGVVIPYVIGESGAEVATNAVVSQSCLGIVGWAINTNACYFTGSFTAVNYVGHVGQAPVITFCVIAICVNTGQMFGGVGGWIAGPLGNTDTVEAGLEF